VVVHIQGVLGSSNSYITVSHVAITKIQATKLHEPDRCHSCRCAPVASVWRSIKRDDDVTNTKLASGNILSYPLYAHLSSAAISSSCLSREQWTLLGSPHKNTVLCVQADDTVRRSDTQDRVNPRGAGVLNGRKHQSASVLATPN